MAWDAQQRLEMGAAAAEPRRGVAGVEAGIAPGAAEVVRASRALQY